MSDHDVIVLGTVSGGVSAAVETARGGPSVLLIEPGEHIGGMASDGLRYTDIGEPRVLGGPAARFCQDVADHYGTAVGHRDDPEPHVAEQILRSWLDRARIEVRTERILVNVAQEDTATGRLISALHLTEA